MPSRKRTSGKRKQPTRKQRKQTRKFTMKKNSKGGGDYVEKFRNTVDRSYIYSDEYVWQNLNADLITKLNNFKFRNSGNSEKELLLSSKIDLDKMYKNLPTYNDTHYDEYVSIQKQYIELLKKIREYQLEYTEYIEDCQLYIPISFKNDVIEIIEEAKKINKNPSDYLTSCVKSDILRESLETTKTDVQNKIADIQKLITPHILYSIRGF